MNSSVKNVVCFVGFLVINSFLQSSADPTDGFTNVPLTEANFEIQRPYNVPLDERYSFENGIRKMWVYANDKPHSPNSETQPRTEVRIHVNQFFSPITMLQIPLHLSLIIFSPVRLRFNRRRR